MEKKTELVDDGLNFARCRFKSLQCLWTHVGWIVLIVLYYSESPLRSPPDICMYSWFQILNYFFHSPQEYLEAKQQYI